MPRIALPREFYIPKGATKIADRHSDAVAYIWADARGRPGVTLFLGKSLKPALNCYFLSAEAREKRIRGVFAGAKRSADAKAERRAEAKAFRHDFKVGDVLCTSWGYDQTNVDCFQVTVTTPGTITVRQIASKMEQQAGYSSMAGFKTPQPGSFLKGAEPIRCRPSPGGVSIQGHYASKWDGKPKYTSWYA